MLALEGFWSGCPAQGIAHGQEAIALLEQAHDHWWAGMAHCYVAFSCVSTGQFDAAFAAAARARDVGLRIGDARLQCYADFTTGWGQANRGEGSTAIDTCRHGVELATDPVSRVYASLFLGYAYLEHGELARALAELEPAIVRLEEFGIPYWRGWAAAMIADAHRLTGHVDRAVDYARLGLEISTPVHFRLGVGLAHRALGRAASSDRRLDGRGVQPARGARDIRRDWRAIRIRAHPSGSRPPSRANATTALARSHIWHTLVRCSWRWA